MMQNITENLCCRRFRIIFKPGVLIVFRYFLFELSGAVIAEVIIGTVVFQIRKNQFVLFTGIALFELRGSHIILNDTAPLEIFHQKDINI